MSKTAAERRRRRRPPRPGPPRPERKRVSLAFVLADLEQAVDGVARLVEGVEADHFHEADVRVVCRSAVAMLSLIADRLRVGYLAVIGERDPKLLHSRHTSAPVALPGLPPTQDVVLEAEVLPPARWRRR